MLLAARGSRQVEGVTEELQDDPLRAALQAQGRRIQRQALGLAIAVTLLALLWP